MGQWVALTEENNGIQIPSPGSGIPGAPLSPSYQVPPGLEKHFPVLFLDIRGKLGVPF
jgi:kinesin family protein 13